MEHYADRETSGSEYEGAACVLGQLAFWEDDVSMYGDGRVNRCTVCLWVPIYLHRSTGKLSVTIMMRRMKMSGVCQRPSATKWATLETT